MQNVVSDKPYAFVPPHHSRFWPNIMRFYLPSYLNKYHGIESCSFSGTEKLKSSIQAGHGIMLTPNHCRPCDPLIVGQMTASFNQPLYVVASSHLFRGNGFLPWILPRLGVFSIYREGLDRDALKCATQVLVEAKRPLVIFPEGTISHTNDRLNHLMDGTVFIARTAAKQLAGITPSRKVVVHPVAIRYFFGGNIEETIRPVLTDIERRLSWQLQTEKSLLDRIYKVGDALLTLKEIEYFDQPQTGTLAERLARLLDKLLVPIEEEWLKGKKREKDVISRVKAIRTAILPDLVTGEIPETEKARRWRQLTDITLAQQIFFYHPDYWSKPDPTPEQLMETVERYEEDLTDVTRIHRPVHASVEVGDAIEVNPVRERGVETDPVMTGIRTQLEDMLLRLKDKRPSHFTPSRKA